MGNVNPMLTIGEIERALGYAKGSLTSLRAKGYFTEPDAVYGRTPLWRPSTITKWNNERKSEG